ncbi:MAG: hypothetical protein SGJ20_18570 [Planctomycetota bacterium]|nr:hypothetical protein [Planctomycetota bacterium]
MARKEADREDLLRDAVAFKDRALFSVPGMQGEIFVGLRDDNAGSIYVGADPVYHFNAQQQLRRAFVDGLLYKAEQGKLVVMERQRSAEATILESRQLSVEEAKQFVQRMQSLLVQICAALLSSSVTLIGQVTAEQTANRGETAMERITSWLAQQRLEPREICVADSAGL